MANSKSNRTGADSLGGQGGVTPIVHVAVAVRTEGAASLGGRSGATLSRPKKKSDRPPIAHYAGIGVCILLVVSVIYAVAAWGVPAIDGMLAGQDDGAESASDPKAKGKSPDEPRRAAPSPAPPVAADDEKENGAGSASDPKPDDGTSGGATEPSEPEPMDPDPVESPTGEDESKSKFPKSVDLPPLAETAAATIAELDAESVKVQELVPTSEFCRLEKDQYFHALLDPTFKEGQKWLFRLVAKDQEPAKQPPLAELWLVGPQVQFQWLEAAAKTPAAAQLRNCIVRVSSEGSSRRMALRKPAVIEPITLNLDKRNQTEQLTIDAPPRLDGAVLEIVTLDQFPAAKFRLNRRSAPLKKDQPESIVVELKKINEGDVPEIHIQPTLGAEDVINIRVTPLLVNSKGRHEMTTAAVLEVQTKLEQEFATIDKDYNLKRDEGIDLERKIRDAQQRASGRASAKEKAASAASQQRMRARLVTVNKEFKQIEAKRNKLAPIVKGAPAVSAVVNALHKTSILRYRIRVKSGEMSLDLCETKTD